MDLTDPLPEPASPPQRASRTPRVVAWLALGGVSVIAGIASYFHALEVVEAAGAVAPVAFLVPALADLVILGASADFIHASRAGAPRPVLTMVSLGVGIAVTLAMNVAAGSHHGLGGRLVAGWPALAFTLALESLAGLVRRGRGGSSPRLAPAAPATEVVTVGCGHGVAEDRDGKIRDLWEHTEVCLGLKPSLRGVGNAVGVHHDIVRQVVTAAGGTGADEPEEVTAGV